MLGVRLYLAQRLSALVMAPLVLGHLALMVYAVQGGLSAEEILARTRGSAGWALYYGVFVVAVAVHAAIGLRVIAYEWGGLGRRALDAVMLGSGAVLLALGLHAVYAVVA